MLLVDERNLRLVLNFIVVDVEVISSALSLVDLPVRPPIQTLALWLGRSLDVEVVNHLQLLLLSLALDSSKVVARHHPHLVLAHEIVLVRPLVEIR